MLKPAVVAIDSILKIFDRKFIDLVFNNCSSIVNPTVNKIIKIKNLNSLAKSNCLKFLVFKCVRRKGFKEKIKITIDIIKKIEKFDKNLKKPKPPKETVLKENTRELKILPVNNEEIVQIKIVKIKKIVIKDLIIYFGKTSGVEI
jgi:hypothetical protein